MMSEKQFKDLVRRLDTLIKLTAMNALQGKSMIEQIRILSELGLQPRQIASLLGTSANYVRVAKSKLKKRKTKGRNKAKQKRSTKRTTSGDNKK